MTLKDAGLSTHFWRHGDKRVFLPLPASHFSFNTLTG